MAALDPYPADSYNNVVVIGIDKDKNSQYAVKWAVNNLVVKDQRPVFLVHVRTQSLNDNPASDARTGRAPTDEEMHQLFLPYRGFCARKGIDAKEVVLHDIEVSSALIEYITVNLISSVVVGASNRNILTRKLKSMSVPTSLGKSAPDYCAVYVAGKGKAHCIRSPTTTPTSPRLSTSSGTSSEKSTPRLTSSSTMLHQFLQYTPNSNAPTSSDSVVHIIEGDTTNKMSNDKHHLQRKFTKSPKLHRSTLNNSSSPERSSLTSKSEDSASNSFRYNGGLDPLSMTSSSSNSRVSKTTRSSLSCSSSSSGSTIYTQDLEAEMQRLRLHLQQSMEALKTLRNEADTSKQELDDNKPNASEDIKREREATTAFEEMEKYKQKAVMDVAHISEQLEEMETHTRNKKNSEGEGGEGVERKGASKKWTSNAIRYKKYSLEEIESATDFFSTSLKVGEGGYGPVYRAVLDHTQVAIKVLRPDVSQGLNQFKKEIEVLSRMKHPNLVCLLGACPEYGCLVYEYMDYGSLEDRLFLKENTPPIPWRIRFQISAEIATALHSLHSTKPEPLVHRDLKPANILLDHNFVPKICDVGLARLVPPSATESMTNCHMTVAAGTFFYIDPEYQQTGMLSVKSDVYSLGVVLLQIITGRPPMGLSHAVESAIEEGNLAEILDPTVQGWPLEEALSFARMALKCCELRKRDRPDLGLEVLPELTRLSSYATYSPSPA